MSDLDRLVNCFVHDPVERCRKLADAALISWDMPEAVVGSWDSFVGLMIRLLPHVEQHLYGLKEPVVGSPQFAWGRCLHVLSQAYGTDGAKVAFEISRTGKEGGVVGVVKKVAYHLADEMAKTHIHLGAHSFWDSLSVQEKQAAADEFLQQFGHMLPSELTEGGAWRVRASLPAVLERFAGMLRALSQTRVG